MDFKQGDKVTWKSQAAGSVKIKTGIFLGVVEPYEDAHRYVPKKIRQLRSRIKGVNQSSLLRAAVEVPRPGEGRGSDYYFPRLSVIRLAE